jgi:ATP-binding cassette subfamily F protein uup
MYRVAILSGGERRRLQLLTVLTKRPNFLILDEPTNDLDVDTLSALEEYLTEEFKGVLLLVSHDRYFTDKVTDHLFVLEGNGVVKDYQGTLSDYSDAIGEMELMKQSSSPSSSGNQSSGGAAAQSSQSSGLSAKEEKENRVAKRNMLQKYKRELNTLEPAIEKLKAKSVDLEKQISGKSDEGWSVLADLTEQMNVLQNDIDEKEMRWMELAEIMEEEEAAV